MSSNTLQNNTK